MPSAWISLCLLLFALWIGYQRRRISKFSRTRTEGSSMITSSVVDKLDAYQFYNRTEQKAHAYLEFKHTVYKDGSCGDLQIPPLKRLCTPYLHVHPHQKESFTLLQGQLGYQLGDRINSCDIRTCPSPIVVQPLVVHSFWMTDDREDLILTVRIEPTYEDHGLSASAFENIVGTILKLIPFRYPYRGRNGSFDAVRGSVIYWAIK